MATAALDGMPQNPDALSIPVTADVGGKITAALLRISKENKPTDNRLYDTLSPAATNGSIMVRDLVAVLKPGPAKKLGIHSVVENNSLQVLSGPGLMPIPKLETDSILHLTKENKDQVERDELASCFSFAGVATALYDGAAGYTSDGKIGVNLFGFGETTMLLDKDIAPFSRVVLSVPKKEYLGMSRNNKQYERPAFTVQEFNSQNIVNFIRTCVLELPRKSKEVGGKKTSPIDIDALKSNSMKKNIIKSRRYEVGSMVLLSLLNFEKLFEGKPYDDLDSIINGKVVSSDGNPVTTAENNWLPMLVNAFCSVVANEFNVIGTVYSVRGNAVPGNPHYRKVTLFCSSLH